MASKESLLAEARKTVEGSKSTSSKKSRDTAEKTLSRTLETLKLEIDYEKTTAQELGETLTIIATSIRQKKGKKYTEGSQKTVFNNIVALAIEKYNKHHPSNKLTTSDPHLEEAFKANQAARKITVEKDPSKATRSAKPFTADQLVLILEFHDSSTPEGLLRRSILHLSFCFAWRGKESYSVKPCHFRKGRDIYGKETNKIIFHRAFDKNHKDVGTMAEEKFIGEEGKFYAECRRLFGLILEHRPKEADEKDLGLFLMPNPDWAEGKPWFLNRNFGDRHNIVKETAKQLGFDVDLHRFTDHSLRATVITLLQAAGASTAEAAKVSGHTNLNSVANYTHVDSNRQASLMDGAVFKKPLPHSVYRGPPEITVDEPTHHPPVFYTPNQPITYNSYKPTNPPPQPPTYMNCSVTINNNYSFNAPQPKQKKRKMMNFLSQPLPFKRDSDEDEVD